MIVFKRLLNLHVIPITDYSVIFVPASQDNIQICQYSNGLWYPQDVDEKYFNSTAVTQNKDLDLKPTQANMVYFLELPQNPRCLGRIKKFQICYHYEQKPDKLKNVKFTLYDKKRNNISSVSPKLNKYENNCVVTNKTCCPVLETQKKMFRVKGSDSIGIWAEMGDTFELWHYNSTIKMEACSVPSGKKDETNINWTTCRKTTYNPIFRIWIGR